MPLVPRTAQPPAPRRWRPAWPTLLALLAENLSSRQWIRRFEQQGLEFALPTRTLHLEGDWLDDLRDDLGQDEAGDGAARSGTPADGADSDSGSDSGASSQAVGSTGPAREASA